MTTCAQGGLTVTPRLAGAPFLVFTRDQATPTTPAVILEQPKSGWNVALTIRACWSFGIPQLWLAADRLELEPFGERPAYEDAGAATDYISVVRDPDPLAAYLERDGVTVVAVERHAAIRTAGRPWWQHLPLASLGMYRHPERAVYVFGPEDGQVSDATLQRARVVLEIPSRHSLNLALAVGIVLGDRARTGGTS